MKNCILYDRECTDCKECEKCDINPEKICDNCGKCIESVDDFRAVKIDRIIIDEIN